MSIATLPTVPYLESFIKGSSYDILLLSLIFLRDCNLLSVIKYEFGTVSIPFSMAKSSAPFDDKRT